METINDDFYGEIIKLSEKIKEQQNKKSEKKGDSDGKRTIHGQQR